MSMDKFCELIKGKKPVFVIFFATWCPHCQRMMPIVSKLKDRKELIFLAYDIDDPENKRLIDYYHVQAVPLMMVYRSGEQLWRWNGEIEESELMQTIDRLLV